MLTVEVSEQLLRLVGSVLDIRQVFPEISSVVQPAIAHDRLTMTLHDGERTLVAHAFSNDDGPFLVRIHGTQIEALQDGWHRIVDDIASMPIRPGLRSSRRTTARSCPRPGTGP